MKRIDEENGNNWYEGVYKILHTKETKEESFVLWDLKVWRQDHIKYSEEMAEKYNMNNEIFQKERASRNK